MIFGQMMTYALRFFEFVSDAYTWFFTETTVNSIVSRYPVGATGGVFGVIISFIANHSDVFSGTSFIPAELFFRFGVGVILLFIIVKFVAPFF